MRQVKWALTYAAIPTAYRWRLTGFNPDGTLWVEYAFSARPSRRVIARTRKAKRGAVIVIY